MKAIFTSLMILMVSFAIAQSPLYTYVDANKNKYEIFADQVKYAPATGTAKTIVLTKAQASDLDTKCKAAIAAKTEQQDNAKLGASTIIYPVALRTSTIYMKSSSATKTSLETALSALVQ